MLKAKLDDKKGGAWAKELLWVLWAYWTTARTSTGETPLSLAYGTKVMIPVEMGVRTYRVLNHNPDQNSANLKLNFYLLEEKRHQTNLRNYNYQRQMERYYNTWVKAKRFTVGDLVL